MKDIKNIKDIKNCLKNYRLKSLYVKWVIVFTGLIILAQIITMGITFLISTQDIGLQQNERLLKKVEFIKELHSKGFEVTTETIANIDVNLTFLDKDINEETNEEYSQYKDVISLSMLQKAQDGDIVSSYVEPGNFRSPFYLVLIGDKIALVTPKLEGNVILIFIKILRTSISIGSVIGSVFIVLALIVFIKPIKTVTAATREVAKGNFNVKLKTNSVNEIGQLIENFNTMTSELQKNEYLKKDFVSSVSHEFKTPITSIEGFAKLIKNRELTEEQFEEYTEIIIKETKRLSNLSSNLLKLSFLDSTGIEPTKSQFYLDEQIRNVILLLENQWEEKDIEFDIDMEEVLFEANEELLSQVWINLIQNAIKFSDKKGIIKIKLIKNLDNTILVTIQDEGIGIPSIHFDNIFDRFYKVDKSRSKEGSGLGLSIVKRIVEISKGEIYFESDFKKGTVFYVKLNKTKLK